MLLLKHSLQQLLDLNLAGQEGLVPPLAQQSSSYLLVTAGNSLGSCGNATGVQQRRVKAQEMMDVLLVMSSPPQESEDAGKEVFGKAERTLM